MSELSQQMRQWAQDYSTDVDRDVFIEVADELDEHAEQIERLNARVVELMTERDRLKTEFALAQPLYSRRQLEARFERARKALEEIVSMHDGNQPPALNMPDLDYARRVIGSIHRVARAALSDEQRGQ